MCSEERTCAARCKICKRDSKGAYIVIVGGPQVEIICLYSGSEQHDSNNKRTQTSFRDYNNDASVVCVGRCLFCWKRHLNVQQRTHTLVRGCARSHAITHKREKNHLKVMRTRENKKAFCKINRSRWPLVRCYTIHAHGRARAHTHTSPLSVYSNGFNVGLPGKIYRYINERARSNACVENRTCCVV